jgi:hypothetical protein
MMRSNDIGRAKELLAKACKMGKRDWADIEQRLSNGHAQLWDCGPAMLVTEVTVDDKCNIALAGGKDVKSWFHEAEKAVKEWSVKHGCTAMTLWGRLGWQKILPHWENRGVDDGLVFLELSYEK